MADAIRNFGGTLDALPSARLEASQLLGYAEVHIEQGPVLEQKDVAVGVVTAIAGQSRLRIRFIGRAGHAGTVPMNLRHDALCAAAEFVLAAEAVGQNVGGLVATVGEIAALPGVSNVVPGEAQLSLDLRHPDDAVRQRACDELKKRAEEIAAGRAVAARWEVVQETQAVICERRLTILLNQAVQRHQEQAPLLHSGAGHDAAAMAAITPVAMLFVRCRGGISHHPDELATVDDVCVALAVTNDFLAQLAKPVDLQETR
jgi:allantoate deiminase